MLSFGGTSSVALRSAFSLTTSAEPIDVADSNAMIESPAHLTKNREFIDFSLYGHGPGKAPPAADFNPPTHDMFQRRHELGTSRQHGAFVFEHAWRGSLKGGCGES